MIVKLEYQDYDLVGIRTNYNNKIKNHHIRLIVDEYSIEKAIKQTRGNKWVVALDYEGDTQYLSAIKEIPLIPVIVTKEFKEVNELSVSFFMKCLPDWVTVSIKTPSDFSDMRLVETLSQEFKNIRFCGGKFLRLPGCNIGCIQRSDIHTKIAESKISYYTEGCSCILESMNISEVEGVDLLFKGTETEKQVKKEENKKKIINNIEDLLNL